MLLKFASLIAFDKFERFVLKKHRASLIAFERFDRFVVKKLHARCTIPSFSFLIGFNPRKSRTKVPRKSSKWQDKGRLAGKFRYFWKRIHNFERFYGAVFANSLQQAPHKGNECGCQHDESQRKRGRVISAELSQTSYILKTI